MIFFLPRINKVILVVYDVVVLSSSRARRIIVKKYFYNNKNPKMVNCRVKMRGKDTVNSCKHGFYSY